MKTLDTLRSTIRVAIAEIKSTQTPLKLADRIIDSIRSLDIDSMPSRMSFYICDALVSSARLSMIYRIPFPYPSADVDKLPECRSYVEHSDLLEASASAIARTVKVYEQIVPIGRHDHLVPLGEQLDSLERQLIDVAAQGGCDLQSALSCILSRERSITASESYVYHPSNATSLESFLVIQERTACPFAKAARLWGAPSWIGELDVAGNAERIAPVLKNFANLQRWEALDGFVVEISGRNLTHSLTDLCATFRSLLKCLNSLDENATDLFSREVRSRRWQFEFSGVRMFLIVFSPLYDAHSPRDTYGHPSTFVFFQPQESFFQHKALRDRDIGSDLVELSNLLSDRFANIRKKFSDIGKAYDCSIMREPFQAPRYLKPLRVGDPAVEWWKEHLE